MASCGTVCRMPIFLLRRHFILVLWLCFSFFVFWTTYSKYKREPKHFYLRQIIGSGLCVSRGMASVLNVSCFMVIVPMCRFLSSCIQVLGSKFSSTFICKWGHFSKSFHITCAYTIVFASAFHSIAHIVNAWNFCRFYNSKFGEANIAKAKGEDPLWLVVMTVPGLTGVLMMLILCILASSSSKYLRYTNYDLFWFSHHLFVIFLLLLLCHPMSGMLKEQSNVSSHSPGCQLNNYSISLPEDSAKNCTGNPIFVPQVTNTWKWITAAFSLYLIDMGYRAFRRISPSCIMSVQSFNCHLLHLRIFNEGFVARPGQFLYLQCPSVSALEWHPFSISKCPSKEDPCFSIHLRTKGDWSCFLQHRLFLEVATDGQHTASPPSDFSYNNSSEFTLATKLIVDGPFGSAMENVLNHSVSICIAGGIGVTPFASVLSFLRFQQGC